MTDEQETNQEILDATEGEEWDLIDQLIADLNDGVDGITFERDVLETNRPEDWGAVELSGQADGEWADGTLIDQVLTADIWVCLSDRGSHVKRQVQTVLKAFCGEIQTGWRLVNRAWLYDLNKVMWHWVVTIDGPLAMELAENLQGDPKDPNPTEDPLDLLPFADPEEDPEDDPEWQETDPEEGES